MKDCSSQNRILDIINLSSDNINNKIEIGPGVYDLSFHSDTDASIKLRSNTLCKIDGTIRVMQNNLTGYYLIYLKDVNHYLNHIIHLLKLKQKIEKKFMTLNIYM